MKLFVPAVMLLTAVANADMAANAEMASTAQAQEVQLDYGKLLDGLAPLIQKAKCVTPTLITAANNIKSCHQGLLTAACEALPSIKADKEVQAALKRCGVDQTAAGVVFKFVGNLCGKLLH